MGTELGFGGPESHQRQCKVNYRSTLAGTYSNFPLPREHTHGISFVNSLTDDSGSSHLVIHTVELESRNRVQGKARAVCIDMVKRLLSDH